MQPWSGAPQTVRPADVIDHQALGYTYDTLLSPPSFNPSPNQFTPTKGVWDSQVTLLGKNFNMGAVKVRFGPNTLLPQHPLSVSATQIVVKVPAGTGSGPLEGPVRITVSNDAGSVTSSDLFTVIPT